MGDLATPYWDATARSGGDNYPVMGNRLKALRDRHRWTQQQVADKFGRSLGWYRKKENGERELKARDIERASQIFDVSQAEVIGERAAESQVVPLVAWVSAGVMMREDLADESLGELKLSDLPAGDWIALRVVGDSMDRVSPPESIILVNRADKRLVPNALYIIADEDGKATYKRYRPNPLRFEPVSVNPEHSTLYPDQEPVIIGRVRRTILNH